jgi:hypothetical protein
MTISALLLVLLFLSYISTYNITCIIIIIRLLLYLILLLPITMIIIIELSNN